MSAAVLAAFTWLNIVSVKNTGRIEDILAYSKLVNLSILAFVRFCSADMQAAPFSLSDDLHMGSLLVTASISFVAFEGLQLAIHANSDVRDQRGRFSGPRA